MYTHIMLLIQFYDEIYKSLKVDAEMHLSFMRICWKIPFRILMYAIN